MSQANLRFRQALTAVPSEALSLLPRGLPYEVAGWASEDRRLETMSHEMNWTEQVRQIVDEILWGQPDDMERRCGFVHLYGVTQACALLTLKRGLDVELGTIAGMLHDLWSCKNCDPTDHGRRGAPLASGVLSGLGCFTGGEIRTICEAIALHRIKGDVHGTYAELPKDSDVPQHNTYNMQFEPIRKEFERLAEVWRKLGIERTVAPTQHPSSEV